MTDTTGRFGIYVMGGLGNQIFQYLFALRLREQVGDRVVLLVDWFLANGMLGREPGRPLLLHRFPNIKLPLSSLGLLAEQGLAFGRIHRENDGDLDIRQPGNVLVFGYHQNAAALPAPAEIADFCQGIAQPSAADPHTVALHLRLGDYKTLAQVLPLTYYERALAEQPAGSRFIVFSENAAEAEDYLRPLANRFRFEFRPPADPIEDFRQLATMPAVIGANSTFSYLAGLAARMRGARVTLPAAEHWHAAPYRREIEGKRALLAYTDFRVIA